MIRIRYKKVFRNVRINLFAFLGALVLWLYVVTNNVFTHVQKVPLRFTNVPRGSILVRPVPDFVRVEFRGTGRELLLSGSREKWIELDLEHAGPSSVVTLGKDMVKGIPRGSAVVPVRVVEPGSVSIEFDDYAVKKIPVESNLTFLPLDGYIQVGEVRFEPDTITISGPKSMVSPVVSILTVSRELRNLLKPIAGKTDLVLPSGENLQWTAQSVRFHADIQRLGERVLSEVPVQVLHVPSNTRVRVVPPTLSLKLQGGVNVISHLKKEDIRASIDFTQHPRHRDRNLAATIHVPPDVGFLDVHPPFFEILVEKP